MIELVRSAGGIGAIELSPVSLKVECYLRMAGLSYQSVYNGFIRHGQSPTKQVPFITDTDGTVVAESEQIIVYLENKYGNRLNGNLTSEQKAIGHGVHRICDQSIYYVAGIERWHKDYGLKTITDHWSDVYLPHNILFPVSKFFFTLLLTKSRYGLKRILGHYGAYGGHSMATIFEMGDRDLGAISTLLGSKPYLFGDKPSSYDAAIFGAVHNFYALSYSSELRKLTDEKYPNIVEHHERIRNRYFSGHPGNHHETITYMAEEEMRESLG